MKVRTRKTIIFCLLSFIFTVCILPCFGCTNKDSTTSQDKMEDILLTKHNFTSFLDLNASTELQNIEYVEESIKWSDILNRYEIDGSYIISYTIKVKTQPKGDYRFKNAKVSASISVPLNNGSTIKRNASLDIDYNGNGEIVLYTNIKANKIDTLSLNFVSTTATITEADGVVLK